MTRDDSFKAYAVGFSRSIPGAHDRKPKKALSVSEVCQIARALRVSPSSETKSLAPKSFHTLLMRE